VSCTPSHSGRGAAFRLYAVLLASLWPAGCSGTKSGSSEGQASPPPRAIRVDEATVVIEGRWHPIEATADSPIVMNSVRAVCVRADRRCREDLTTTPEGAAPVTESFEYRVKEWTRAKLLAARRKGADEVIVTVSLTGLAAEKVLVKAEGDRDAGTRWRLE
jgi:hypothetical protein